MKFIITYFPEFRKNSLKEIKTLDKDVKEISIANNLSIVESSLSKKDFLKKLSEENIIFVRHIMPADREIELTNNQEEDSERILNHVKEICSLKKGQPFSVQTRIISGAMDYKSKDMEVYVGQYYEKIGACPIFSDSSIIDCDSFIISILIQEQRCYIGFSKSADNLNFHSDEYRLLSRESREISRAENKLKEAINKFHIKVRGEGYALDVGAAPGGWTKVLADYGFQVSAVDPGDLNQKLENYKNIKHYKDRIENIKFDHLFHIITCDMNTDPQITAKIMCELCDNMEKEGICIITLKLPFMDIERSIGESIDILEEKFDILNIKNLTHNRREVTVLMKKRDLI